MQIWGATMEQIRAHFVKFSAVILVSIMIVSCMPLVIQGASRTGTTGNEPSYGFMEAKETIEIYHTDNTHNTNFLNGDTVNIRITSTDITSASGQANNNIVQIYSSSGAQIGTDHKPFFTKIGAGGPPYIYEGSFVADAANGFNTNDNFVLKLFLRQGGGGNNQVRFWDVIHVGAPSTEEKYIRLFNEPTYSTETYQFSPTGKLFVSVWTGANQPDATASDVVMRTYTGLTAQKQIAQLANPTITKVGNYTRFVYDISADLAGALTLTNKEWYTLAVLLNDGTTDLVRDWAVQFKINNTLANPPVVHQGDTTAVSASIMVGLQSTTISTPFTHADAPSANLFKITYKVRSVTNAVTTLVDNATNGQGGVTVTQDAVHKTNFTASISWAPGAVQELGMYDLYFYVNDTVNSAQDAYVNNADELELKTPPAVPKIIAGATKANPPVVQAPGSDKTVISVNFTHADGPLADSFMISFSVRDPGNTVLQLVVSQHSGAVAGLTVVKTGATSYIANFSWDPPTASVLGSYDLYSRVDDANSAYAEDSFASNLNELTLTKPSAYPTVLAGSTTAVPSSINRTGGETTVISTPFRHDDIPGVSAFTVSYIVRDEANVNYTLVNNLHTGFSGLTIQDLGNGNYSAYFVWDPADNQPLGKYDLCFKVIDSNYHTAQDGCDSNPDELTITKKPSPPVMGAITATPYVVNVEGAETTTIATKFSHVDMPVITVFKMTIKVRDVGNLEYTLVNGAVSGSPGLTVQTDTKGNYTASFIWDPPSTGQPLGTYDLCSIVEDQNGMKAQDCFANYQDVLTLVRSSTPSNGTISGLVKDLKGKPIANATVKVINATNNEVVKTFTTGADGKFSGTVPAGLYNIVAQVPDYQGETVANKQVKVGAALIVPDFTLLKMTGGTGKTIIKEVVPTYMYGLIVLLIVIIVLLCLFMLMRTGKSEPSHSGPRSPTHQHSTGGDNVAPDHPLEPKEEKEMEDEPKAIPKDRIRIEKLKDEPKEE
jgi:hypothetical protein